MPCGLRMAGPDAALDIADTRAIVHLTTITAFGDAILGKRLRRAAESGRRNRADANGLKTGSVNC